MRIKVIKEKISREETQTIAEKTYGTMLKIAVDIKKKIVAAGGEFHSECQEALIKQGCQAQDIWGANILLDKPQRERIEYIALINIKPSLGHYEMEIKSPTTKEKIQQIIDRLIE